VSKTGQLIEISNILVRKKGFTIRSLNREESKLKYKTIDLRITCEYSGLSLEMEMGSKIANNNKTILSLTCSSIFGVVKVLEWVDEALRILTKVAVIDEL